MAKKKKRKDIVSAKQRGEWNRLLMEALEEYVGKEREIAAECFEAAAENTRDDLRHTSPGAPGGDYAKGWEVVKRSSGITTKQVNYVVCNPEHYRLTHLLERGHQSFNQYGGPYRRVKAYKHIKKAEVRGVEGLLKMLRGDL